MAADRRHASLNSGKKVRGEAGALRVIPAVGVVEIKLSLRGEAKPLHFRRLSLA